MEHRISKGMGGKHSIMELDLPHGMRFINATDTSVQIECPDGMEVQVIHHLSEWMTKMQPHILTENQRRGRELAERQAKRTKRNEEAFNGPPAIPGSAANVDLASRHAVIAPQQQPPQLGQSIIEGDDVPDQT